MTSFMICPSHQTLVGWSKRIGCVGHVSYMREKRNACRVLVGKPEGKRAPGRPRHKWKFTLKQAIKVQKGSIGIPLLFL